MWSSMNYRKMQILPLRLTELRAFFRNSQFIGPIRSFCSVEGRKTCTEQNHKIDSFTITYLVDSCGLSLESANSSSRYVTLRSPEKPDSVLELLKNHGFTGNQITRVVKFFPKILTYNVEKTLLPKLKFFSSIGLSSTETAKLVSLWPTTLSRGLHSCLIPCYDFLKTVLSRNDDIIRFLKASPRGLLLNSEKDIVPKLSCLRSNGVPQINLVRLFLYAPRAVESNVHRFREIVEKVHSLGFDPSKVYYFVALNMISGMRDSTLQHKVELYKLCGWSEEDCKLAFKKHPFCMRVSDQKIKRTMEFLVKNVGLKPSVIAKSSVILSLSFEERLVPRCLKVAALLSQGILKAEKVGYVAILMMSDEKFQDKFVTKYQKDVPQISDFSSTRPIQPDR